MHAPRISWLGWARVGRHQGDVGLDVVGVDLQKNHTVDKFLCRIRTILGLKRKQDWLNLGWYREVTNVQCWVIVTSAASPGIVVFFFSGCFFER